MANTKKPAPHPGTVLREEYIEPNGINANTLSLSLRVPQNRIGAILKGLRGVSPDTALRLARFFGTTPEYWLDLQRDHDLGKARAQSGEEIVRDVRIYAGKK